MSNSYLQKLQVNWISIQFDNFVTQYHSGIMINNLLINTLYYNTTNIWINNQNCRDMSDYCTYRCRELSLGFFLIRFRVWVILADKWICLVFAPKVFNCVNGGYFSVNIKNDLLQWSAPAVQKSFSAPV